MTVRPARPADSARLREIERHAGERFRTVGLGHVADHEPFGVDVLDEYAHDGRSWVAVGGDDTPVGYVLVDEVDGNAHVEQVSVAPEHQGRGLARALLDEVLRWAAAGGCPAVTLTTFREVPWNQPLYEHLGFRAMDDDEVGPELRAVVAAEAAHGLDPATRVCMRLDLATP